MNNRVVAVTWVMVAFWVVLMFAALGFGLDDLLVHFVWAAVGTFVLGASLDFLTKGEV